MCRDAEVSILKRKISDLEGRLQQAADAEFAALRKYYGSQDRRNHSWAKPTPEKGSLLDPLWQQGLDMDELYTSGDRLECV